MKAKALTLPEMMVVMVLIGTVVFMFYSLFFSNWLSHEIELTRIELQEEADRVMALLERDVLPATNFTVSDSHTVTLTYPVRLNRPDVTYSIDQAGVLNKSDASGASLDLSEELAQVSSFTKGTRGSFMADLTFTAPVLGRDIDFTAFRELYLRN